MHVSKLIDLALLGREMTSAGVDTGGLLLLGTDPADPLEQDVLQADETGQAVELPPEAFPVVDAHDASKPQKLMQFEDAEDAERLALVRERAEQDPAFAALADLTLGTQGV